MRQGEQHRRVALQRGRAEVGVHRRRPVQQGGELVPAEADGAGQPHRRPQRIAPADPVAEGEHLAHPERLRRLRIGRDRDHVPACAGAQPLAQPPARRLRVGQGLLGGEGLGDGHDQGGRRIQAFQRLGDLAGINVGGEAELELRAQGLQRFPHQPRPKVRAADADVHHRLEPLAGGAGDRRAADAFGEGAHGPPAGLDLTRDRLALGREGLAVRRTQRRMHHCPVLRTVDRLAPEQPRPGRLHARGARQRQRGLQRRLRPRLLG